MNANTFIGLHIALYRLTLRSERFQYQDSWYQGAYITLLRDDEPIREYDFSGIIPDYEPVVYQGSLAVSGSYYTEDFLRRECFTLDDAQAIEQYFTRNPYNGLTIHRERVVLPLPESWAAAYGCGDGGRILFHEAPKFDCTLSIEGHYDVENWDGPYSYVPGNNAGLS